MENIDYDALKKRGFLRQKQDGFFVVRARMPYGVYKREHLNKINEIAGKFGRGFVHATTRQGLEIPFIRFEDIDLAEKEIKAAGLETGTSGPRLRTTTCCPGNNWCKSGLINTFSLYDRIEKELDIRCAMDLPHKFKISISGCPNGCTRPGQSEIGIHGIIDTASADKKTGYAVYLGGCGGKAPKQGLRLEKIFSEDKALSVVKNVVEFYKKHGKPKQRLGYLIEEIGKEDFLTKGVKNE